MMRVNFAGGETQMKNKIQNFYRSLFNRSQGEEGSAMVIALLIMILLMGFVALAISRTSNETVASANDAAETHAFEAAHASLEIMTRNFDKVFDLKLNPDAADITRIQSQKPTDFEPEYKFDDQVISQTMSTRVVTIAAGDFQGLNALRDRWQLDTIAEHSKTGVKVALRREFYNNRIPIFQFGIFYDDDLEFHPGPTFAFGGRVHANGNLFLMANSQLSFSSKVTATREVFTDTAKNNTMLWGNAVRIRNAAGAWVNLTNGMGSVLKNTPGTPVNTGPETPTAYRNANWPTNWSGFGGNLTANVPVLELPFRINSRIQNDTLDYIELIRRPKLVGDVYNDGTGTVAAPNVVPVTAAIADDEITHSERYANKAGIRVSLADSKAKLPGCAAVPDDGSLANRCGVRLDGNPDGLGGAAVVPGARGYRPLQMTDGYTSTELNGERFIARDNLGNPIAGRQVWIKVETVGKDNTGAFQTRDITAEILSLGITEQAPYIAGCGAQCFRLTDPLYTQPGDTAAIRRDKRDGRSVIKLQRFIFGDVRVAGNGDSYLTSLPFGLPGPDGGYNLVRAAERLIPAGLISNPNIIMPGMTPILDDAGHHRDAIVNNNAGVNQRWVVPFPIKMFDAREGVYNADINVNALYPVGATHPGNAVPWAGVMSLVDIDVANLKRFLDGEHNGDFDFPVNSIFEDAQGHALTNADIYDSNGWVLYVSDRRGDFDFDGEYDMEDVFGNNDGVLQSGENINDSRTAPLPGGIETLQADYANEAVRYTGIGNWTSPTQASVLDHRFYRRGVRLINGVTTVAGVRTVQLPGRFVPLTPQNTKGFTVASENGVYVLGDYNATGIMSVGTPTPSIEYQPQNTADHIPASIVSDAVTVLSNAWTDGRSFRYPFTHTNRDATETTVRFAMLAGDSRTSLNAVPNQGGNDLKMCGGVHNFIRFLEDWNTRLNYDGSLINLYNARNNNGTYKSGGGVGVYDPPTRNWVFDATFLDPNRLPPGTPFFQNIQITGFQRVN